MSASDLAVFEFDNVESMNISIGRFASLFTGQTGMLSSCNFPFPVPEPTTDEEKWFLTQVPPETKYIIGFVVGNVAEEIHARAHAEYYLNDERRKIIDSMYDSIPDDQKSKIFADLSAEGYKHERFADEFGAYLQTLLEMENRAKAVLEGLVEEKIVSERLIEEKIVSEGTIGDKSIEEKFITDEHVKAKVISEKSIEEKLVEEKVVSEKLVEEKFVEEKVVEGKVVSEKLIEKKVVLEKLVEEKVVLEKLVEEKIVLEKLVEKK